MCDIVKSIDQQIAGLRAIKQQYLESHPTPEQPFKVVSPSAQLVGVVQTFLHDSLATETLHVCGFGRHARDMRAALAALAALEQGK